MPIVLRHQAAGIAPDQENPRTKYGMAMVLQQQRSDQEMRQRAQDAQYDMQRMGAMGAMREMREPSIGEDDAMLEQEIRSGLYDPDTVRALRQDQRAMRQIMRDTNIDGTQRAQALGNLQSRMRMSRSTGKVQPMMQQMGPAALQTKPPMTEAEYFEDPVRYKDGRAAAMQQIEAANGVLNEDNIHAQMHNNYLAREKFLQNPGGSAAAAPQGQGQPPAPAPAPNAPASAPAAATTSSLPPGSFTGGEGYGESSPVLAQAATQPMANMNAPVGHGAYQPTGSYTSPEVFGAPNVLANTAQPMQQQPAPMQTPATPAQQQPEKKGKRGYISIAPGGGQSAGQPAGQASGGWKSKSTGVYSPDGKFLGDPSLYDEAGANYIRQQAAPPAQLPATQYLPDGTPYNVNVVDMAYDAVNPDRSAGTNYFDPENPEYARMRGADPNIMNPPKNVGKFKGRYGLGGMDYGINPATGNRVTVSVRPGGGLEYDEPTGGPRGKGGVTIMGGKNKPAPAAQQQGVVGVDVSPGGTPVNAGLAAAAPVRISRDDPKVQAALEVAKDPKATDGQQDAAIVTLKGAGYTADEIEKIVQAAPPAAGSYRPSSGDMWGNPNKQPSAKKESTWGTQKDVLDIPGRLIDDISAQATATQRKVLGMPPLNDQEVTDPSGELTETQRKNLRMQPKSKNPTTPELEAGARAAPPVEKAASPEMPEQPSFELVDTTERTPQAVMFLDSMKKFADAKGPEVSKAVMSVYEKKLSDKEKAEVIRGLVKMGVDIVAQDKKIRAEVLRKMPPNKTPKYPLPKNRGKFPTKDTNPRMFET